MKTLKSFLALLAIAACVSAPPALHAQSTDSVQAQSVLRAAPARSTLPELPATSTLPSRQSTTPMEALFLTGLGFAVMGVIRTKAADKDTYPATGDLRNAHNFTVADLYYFLLNRPAYQVAAAAVAPPVCARAGTASKVKTTATSQFFLNGIPLSLTATDNLWTLTGANLAAGACRRYLLLWDGTTATTVVSVQQSVNDPVVANYASNALALAACRFPLPPNGTAIVGILSILNTTNPFIPGTTLLSATGVTDTYIDGIDDSVFQSIQLTP